MGLDKYFTHFPTWMGSTQRQPKDNPKSTKSNLKLNLSSTQLNTNSTHTNTTSSQTQHKLNTNQSLNICVDVM